MNDVRDLEGEMNSHESRLDQESFHCSEEQISERIRVIETKVLVYNLKSDLLISV